jgi:hypothetical protein
MNDNIVNHRRINSDGKTKLQVMPGRVLMIKLCH